MATTSPPLQRIVILTLIGTTFACRSSGGGGDSSSGGGLAPATNTTNTNIAQTPVSADATHPAAATTPGVNLFDSWCALAAGATAVKAQLASAYGQLCNSGHATVLFANNLMSSAFSGNGTPTLLAIAPVSSSGSTTAGTFAAAIKLPSTAKQYFDVVGPLAGDRNTQLAEIQQQNATALGSSPDISPTTSSDQYRVRGWNIHSSVSTKGGFPVITTESVQAYDEYELQAGTLYLITDVTTQAIKTIKDYSVLTAVVQLDGAAFLLSIANVKVDNLGFASTAEKQITTAGQQLIQSEYKLAADNAGH